MQLKILIEEFISNNIAIRKLTDDISEKFNDREDADRLIPEIVEIIRASNFNPALGVSFASLLQLATRKEFIDQYTLEDIREIFLSLLALQEFNLEGYIEAASFEWAVMNNPDEAKDIIEIGIEKAESKIRELKELLFEIEGE